MEENGVSFVEWKEEYVSQERGSRIVHYIFRDSEGKSVLAVVGTERSLRHMVYVVAEEFLSYYSATDNNPIQPGFKWRSRREVVDWLTSMLPKQHQADSPRDSTHSLGSSELLSPQHFSLAHKMDHRVRHLKQSYSDIVWLGAAWTCGKQLKHYPAFCRNGTTIAAQSFVFVMAKEENRYVAYLEDMYEDKKGQKKVKVRWFHHSQEVKAVVRLRNAHPKEVYITPYTQVISVECVDGPAIVLTRDHFEKCIGGFPDNLLGKVHLCFRQFRSNKIKPFDLSKLRGYFDQPIISCLESDTFRNSDSGGKVFRRGENVGKGIKRTRNSGDRKSFLTNHVGAEDVGRKKIMYASLHKNANSAMYNKRLLSSKNVESLRWHVQLFKVDDKIELLCQDSGIRGCWFRCTVLEMSRKQMKLRYSDLEDQDEHGNLEEWVPALRLAAPDKLGMRCLGRPTIRPCPPITDSEETKFEVGAPVDAWWSDGWWEGVVTAVNYTGEDNLQIYIPGENMFINAPRKDLRVSRDWVGGKWVDVKTKPDILSLIGPVTKPPIISTLEKDDKADDSAIPTNVNVSEDKEDLRVSRDWVSAKWVDAKTNTDILSVIGPETKPPMISTPEKDDNADDSAILTKVDVHEDKEPDMGGPVSTVVGHPEQIFSDKDDQDDGRHVDDKSDNLSIQDMCCDTDGNCDDQNVSSIENNNGQREGESSAEDLKTAGQSKDVKNDAENTDTAVQNEEALEPTPVVA